MKKNEILIASDHAGFDLKQALQKSMTSYTWTDLGPSSPLRVDYPDFAEKLAKKIVKDNCAGILICGSGIGMSIAANKIDGIRAAVVENTTSARLAKEHNNANVLCLGARFLAPEYAAEIIEAWLSASFDPKESGGRHEARIAKIKLLEGSK